MPALCCMLVLCGTRVALVIPDGEQGLSNIPYLIVPLNAKKVGNDTQSEPQCVRVHVCICVLREN